MKQFGIFLLVIGFFASLNGKAQCTNPITTFPYTQDFEASNGGWTSSSQASTPNTWAWGHPSKTNISGAGGGQKCWITGGLSGNSYGNGERSWVKSPCFNFSGLTRPIIQFKVNWETEKTYDGANLQYSLNGGTSWTNVGAYNQATDCNNANWYNTASVNYLAGLVTNDEGWTGNTQTSGGGGSGCAYGNGSNGWVVAKKCMLALAGQPQVIFRFTFGAGTSCNNFDGFAFDDFSISEASAMVPSITFNCQSTSSRTVSFSGTSTGCPTTYQWNFGDPGSGGSNTANGINANHTFSSAGRYTIQLTVTNSCAGSNQTTLILDLPDATVNPQDILCHGAGNGSATAVGIGLPPATTLYIYSWNTSPVQNTATITGLQAGSYSVTVSSNGTHVCPTLKTIQIQEPAALSVQFTPTPAGCTAPNGSLVANASGGTAPYLYTWIASAQNGPTLNGVSTGMYSVKITDAHNCILIDSAQVGTTSTLTSTISSQSNPLCNSSQDGKIKIESIGPSPISYAWTPNVAQDSVANNLPAGSYQIVVTDGNGCKKTLFTSLTAPPALQMNVLNQGQDTCGQNKGWLELSGIGGTAPLRFLWTRGDTTALITGLRGKMDYALSLSDAVGCKLDSVFQTDMFCPSRLWFPDIFSPNNDGLNDSFQALIKDSLESYHIWIYNRWGQLVFESTENSPGWDGKQNGSTCTEGVYNAIVQYRVKGIDLEENRRIYLLR